MERAKNIKGISFKEHDKVPPGAEKAYKLIYNI
jgi:hypothetical protein